MTPNQIRGYRSRLQAEITQCRNGAEITLDLTTAQKLVEILNQFLGKETK